MAVCIIFNWITKDGSLTQHVNESDTFEESKNIRKRHEAHAWDHMGDIRINEMGWKRGFKHKYS